MRLVQKHLEDHFGDDAKFYKWKSIFHKFHEVFKDEWYEKRKANSVEEKMRIVEAAAEIILHDIRISYYNTETHKRGKSEATIKKWRNRILTIAHAIISSVRPKSFVSTISLGLSLMCIENMHQKH